MNISPIWFRMQFISSSCEVSLKSHQNEILRSLLSSKILAPISWQPTKHALASRSQSFMKQRNHPLYLQTHNVCKHQLLRNSRGVLGSNSTEISLVSHYFWREFHSEYVCGKAPFTYNLTNKAGCTQKSRAKLHTFQ